MVPVPNWVRRLRESLEGGGEEEQNNLRDEVDVQGKVNKSVVRIIAKKSVNSIMNEK